MVLSSLGTLAVSFTDSVVMGNYSTTGLAGVGLGVAVYSLPINALLGGLMALRIYAPRTAGENGRQRDLWGLSLVLRKLVPLALMTSVALSVVCWVVFGESSNSVVREMSAYLKFRAWSATPDIVSSAGVICLVAWGFAKVPLLDFMVTSGVNLVLDVALVYGLGPFPELGASGDGIASSAGSTVGAALVIALLLKNRGPTASRQEIESTFAGWVRLSLPAVFSAAVDYAGNSLFAVIISFGGAAALAGSRVGDQVHMLAFVIVSSLSSAGLVVFGRTNASVANMSTSFIGAFRRTMFFWAVLFGLAIAGMSPVISYLVTPDPSARKAMIVAMLIVAMSCPVAGIAYANVTLLRASEKTGMEFVSNALAVWGAQIPVAAIGMLAVGGIGAFSGIFAYWILRALLTGAQVRRMSGRKS
ncbi:MATE family efflux transporter [Nanchangia anserum]|uniref:Probable multidrug resistance protein NorM n=1 Tax=Nanchangia anserum TaxID=2692125 RepID=A0A8I0G7P0_9ACTO|nr:MATE family efflux transporter [Nanchangia anserum]MBD3689385.1 MATE family efflux transporter [Nanchangia anserum]QOX81592.1 MATE family efflux transporter [Nanchangia anserum]